MEIDEKQVFTLIQKAKETGMLRIGVNEVTKAIERGQAKIVLSATDVSPAEIIAHLPGLSSEMKAGFIKIGTKAELGVVVGIKNTSAIAILDAGSAKKELDEILKFLTEEKETKTEVKIEAKIEETKDDVKEVEKTEEKSSEEEKPKEE